MTHFKEAPIDKDVVILASGESAKCYHAEDYEKIKQTHFIISLNFVNLITPHMRIWSDRNVTDYYEDNDKDCLWVTRKVAIAPHNTKQLLSLVDYWFNEKEEEVEQGLKWTLYWLIHMLRKYFPERKVYVFGMDCHDRVMTSYDRKTAKLKVEERKKNNCIDMPEKFIIINKNKPSFFEGVYNMNYASSVRCIDFKDIQELLGVQV